MVKELSERLVKSGHKVTVYCHRSLFLKKPAIVNGINLVYTPSIETKFLSQLVNSFFSFLHACFTDVDVLLVLNSANGPFGIITKLCNIKTCINVDGLEWLRPKWNGIGSVYFKIASKLATIFYDEIVTDSYEMQKIYNKLFHSKSTVIAYGPNILKSSNFDFLKKINLKKNNYYLVVGRLIPDNNADLIIKGFLKSNSSKKLVIVGGLPYKDKYVDHVKSFSSEKIIFTDYINDSNHLNQLFINSYVYLHGHEYGGTNPTMVNALACGCSILALNTPFSQEMLINGKYGVFFKKNIDSISEKIDWCENNSDFIFKMKKESPKGIKSRYEWNNIVKNYEDLFYKFLLKRKNQ